MLWSVAEKGRSPESDGILEVAFGLLRKKTDRDPVLTCRVSGLADGIFRLTWGYSSYRNH